MTEITGGLCDGKQKEMVTHYLGISINAVAEDGTQRMINVTLLLVHLTHTSIATVAVCEKVCLRLIHQQIVNLLGMGREG